MIQVALNDIRDEFTIDGVVYQVFEKKKLQKLLQQLKEYEQDEKLLRDAAIEMMTALEITPEKLNGGFDLATLTKPLSSIVRMTTTPSWMGGGMDKVRQKFAFIDKLTPIFKKYGARQ